MAEYWQDVLDRAQITHEVWLQYFPTLKLGSTGVADYQTSIEELPNVAVARDGAVQAMDEARQALEFAFQEVRMLGLKVPKLIEGIIDPQSGLLDDLDKVYAITPWSPEKALSRGNLLAPVWISANTWQLAQVPPRPVIVRGATTVAMFQTKLDALPPVEAGVAHNVVTLNGARGTLRRDAAALDRLSKRFLIAATGLVDAGTAAADALATIPTETESPLPETLGIKTFTQGGTGGLQLLIAYEPYDEPDVTAQVLQWQVLDVDAGWDHEVAVDPSGNALGPFTVGQTVRVRTRVTNASGSREGGPRQLTIIQPPS